MKLLVTFIFCCLICQTQGCGEDGAVPEKDVGAFSPINAPIDAPIKTVAATPKGPADPDKLKIHLDAAIDLDKRTIKASTTKGRTIYHAAGDRNDRYTGWLKDPRGDGAVHLFKVTNGVKNGPEVFYHAGGAKWSTVQNVDGKKHGLFRQWDRKGNITKEIQYQHGKRAQQ